MKKRILALLLALVMIVGIIPATALADDSAQTPEITNVNMTLNGVLNVNFKVDAYGANMTGYKLEATIGTDTKKQVITEYTRDDKGRYVYTIDLPAHRMTEDITVILLDASDNSVETSKFNVKTHYVEKVTEQTYTAEMVALVNAMWNYGQYAAYYAGRAEDPAVTEVTDVQASALEAYKYKLHTKPNGVTANMSLYLDRSCDLCMSFGGDDTYTLYIDGSAVEMTDNAYAIEELIPQNWDLAYNIKLVDSSNTTVFETDYSALSYMYNQLKKTGDKAIPEKLAKLLKAMYLYYSAVESYVNKNGLHDSVVTPNVDRKLYKDGESNGYRFIFDTSDSNVKTAVDFINEQFNTLAGAKIDYPGSVDQEAWDATKKYIVVGKEEMFKNAELIMPVDDLGETGYYIVTKDNSVFIMVGENADEAQAYQQAALAFLKAVTGYEMYAADCVGFSVEDGKNLTIPDMRIVAKPDIDYRNRGNYLSVGGGTYGMGYTNSSIFMSVNGNVYHTALDLLNPSDYYGNYKDWFFLEKQAANWWEDILGTQQYEHYQLCYGTILNDTAAQNIIYTNLKAAIQANPTLNNISFGPADNNYICNCDTCTSAGAVASYVKVANLLAERLEADPEITRTVKLIVFAYRQYQNAPSVKTHKNVGVMVAPIEAAYNTPIRDQATYANQIKAWSALTDHLYIWYYQANFDHYLYPMDSWDMMQNNIQFAMENGADFIFYQNQGQAGATAFSKLKDYLESALMRDANADYNTLVNNFFANYYGPAAEQMLQYFNALQTHMNSLTSTGGYKEAINTTTNWPQAKLQEFMGYINNAYAAVKTAGSANASVYNERIKLESLFPRFALLSLYSDTATAGTTNNFAMDCDALNVTNYNEGTAVSASDYSGWWNHTCSTYTEYAHDRCLVSGATEQSGAIYYKTCSACGAINKEQTFVSGSPLNHETHTYTFTAGEGEDEGYDVGTCFCGESTVKVKTDYTDGNPIDIINGDAATLAMPDGFEGTVTGVKFGATDVSYADGKINTTSIQQASHGLWAAIEVTFTSSYGATHTAKVPVTLITEVITTYEQFETFAKEANTANTNSTAMHGYYILGGDIDCAGKTLTTSGGGWNQGFFGTFDGRGHKISNLTASNQGGIFGRLAGTVKNVHFENVAFAANTALFGKICAGATFTNVTVDIGSWVSVSGNMTYAGILGVSENLNNKFDNFVINVANGVSVSNLMGAKFSGTGDITVNLHGTASVVNYYTDASGNAVTTLPTDSIITVKTIEYNNYTVNDAYTAESNSTLTLTHSAFTNGASATVGGQTVTVSNNSVTFSTSALTVGEKNSVIVTIGNDTWTYDNIFCVTKILKTVEDLAHLNVGNASHVKNGYYILGNDIDCNGANIGGASTTNDNNHNLWGNGFTGTFDGRGYAIKNATTTGYGIFGAIDGTIKNVKFEQITFAKDASLFARTMGASSRVTLENVTIDIVGWNSASTDGSVFGRSRTNQVTYTNVVINVADGITITKLFGGTDNAAQNNGNLTVNLGAGSSIALYFADATKPDFVTINTSSSEPVVETIDTLVAGENSTSVTFTQSAINAGNADVTINGQTKTVTAAAGSVTVDLADFGISAMGQIANGAVITTPKGDKLTYTEVWYVTQVIDNATELKALGTLCKDSIVTGYYILGGNIDCSAQATMSNGSASNTTNGFQGTFDGRGKTISNIKMTWDSATGGLGGLFGKLLGCTIKNTTFDNVNLGTNGTLLASGADKNSTTNTNTSLQNLTINLTGYTTRYGVVVGYSMFNTVGSGIVINVADGVTVGKLMARDDCNSIAYIYATVNLGTGSTITNYYGTTTTKPDTITVNQK